MFDSRRWFVYRAANVEKLLSPWQPLACRREDSMLRCLGPCLLISIAFILLAGMALGGFGFEEPIVAPPQQSNATPEMPAPKTDAKLPAIVQHKTAPKGEQLKPKILQARCFTPSPDG